MTKQEGRRAWKRSLEIMRELDPLKGRQRGTHGEKVGKRDETGSSRRETHMERSLEIMGSWIQRRETKGDKPRNENGTESSRRKTKYPKGDKGRQTWKS